MATLFKMSANSFLIIALIGLFGCNHSDKNSSLIFEELNESLERSNKAIERSTRIALEDLRNKASDPAMIEHAKIWLAKANLATTISRKMLDSIDKVTNRLDETDNKEKVQQYFLELNERLRSYKNSLLRSDSVIFKDLNCQFLVFKKKADRSYYNTDSKLLLNELRNSVINMENMIVTYWNSQTCNLGKVTRFQAIAASNSTVFKKGQEMLIQAGVGEFNGHGKPSFVINRVNVLPNENGVGEYKMKINNKPGDYKVPVKIKYTTPDGREDILEKNIEYTVVE